MTRRDHPLLYPTPSARVGLTIQLFSTASASTEPQQVLIVSECRNACSPFVCTSFRLAPVCYSSSTQAKKDAQGSIGNIGISRRNKRSPLRGHTRHTRLLCDYDQDQRSERREEELLNAATTVSPDMSHTTVDLQQGYLPRLNNHGSGTHEQRINGGHHEMRRQSLAKTCSAEVMRRSKCFILIEFQ